MIPERLISEAAIARRKQKQLLIKDGQDFYRNMQTLNPTKPRVRTLAKLRGRRR
jgi:hypothetical protein